MSTIAPEELAKFMLTPENGFQSQAAQISHRQEIISTWGGIRIGENVLELGCGQGDCTIVLAHAVGENGTVDAVDPAPPGYGSPYTVHEAQQHISSTALGPRISWVASDPLNFLPEDSTEPKYDVGVLAHSLWYFSSPLTIRTTLQRLRSLCKRVYIAEWALSASSAPAYPHVLAALTQASLECRKLETVSNVRTVVSSAAIRKLAEDAGLKIVSEGVVVPKAGLKDGFWEVCAVTSQRFLQQIEDKVKDEREKAVVIALRDATLRSLEGLEGGRKAVLSMDVWCGSLSVQERSTHP
ncbi:hypothetical protein HYPSUDRAFT_78462 [Hypholoma sublateritium FD-334 SS-4]|uniref:Uncharacterized protein n=1 Tax=Hypholoma sublateritium (strain FD-334 SS-4) TaxID=945553 RepID=A0A0D2NUC9_HYPSF|nr:hypothetical protein HYPSUDRAFT_78462 [Hypholoma sublateritium FD-334 SS-4]